MKTLSFEQMECIEGGGYQVCASTIEQITLNYAGNLQVLNWYHQMLSSGEIIPANC